ncbi:hypothetical protein [Arthrobacter sp. Br18]|uniref:hypothetical protein n=1 Tax=Arthrobacter sp. Br18 TaxID=1312954 RepID=UPI0004B5F273|nr:hypothetical protein [Arthrobacter sp. Br18]
MTSVHLPLCRTLALLSAAVLLLTGCSGGEESPDAGRTTAAASTAPAAEPPSPEATSPPREAREGWKVFTDPRRLLSFELPADWVVQPAEPGAGVYAADAVHYAVRTPAGITAAELHTGIQTEDPPCPDFGPSPYYVLGSEPLSIPAAPDAVDAIEPRFVMRIIQGFRFFSSYGITDQVGRADGVACTLTNTVQADNPLGRVSFGDLEVLVPKAPANTGPQNVTFGTIGEAQAYFDAPEFAPTRQVIASLQFAAQTG